ncbi:hypothetical protein AGR13a_Cc30117 [Agrobacterium genomosp. 13 str. CFBP 6927]|uniref:Uncharacterized protein n=1 Tax=Agrobacterium genomosp. 13 str. CFBP 6927 TaxID=1183428 RepID=A0ABP2BJH1_9HYPH|nr:hypothetical protein AGR13a_Cc30117 [Agrobacterium genomosp. 13 str. CFBP 6927]
MLKPGHVQITINGHYHHYCAIALTLSYLKKAKTEETVIYSGGRHSDWPAAGVHRQILRGRAVIF